MAALVQHSANQLVLKEDERNAINQDQKFEREFLRFKAGKHAMRDPMAINLLLRIGDRARVIPEAPTVDKVHNEIQHEARE